MNALALFWVTDSVSERSTAPPPLETNAVMDHPAQEMPSEGVSRRKSQGPGAESIEVVSTTNHRQWRQSWSPLMAVDRGLRILFFREPAPRETGTVDVEVGFQFDWSPAQSPRSNISDRGPHRNERRHLFFSRGCPGSRKERQ